MTANPSGSYTCSHTYSFSHDNTDTIHCPTQAPSTESATTNPAASNRLDDEVGVEDEEEPMEQYHIEVAPPLPGTASHAALKAENVMLQDIIVQAGIALEADYAQMMLMDLENEWLRKQAFKKEKRRSHAAPSSGHTGHMTAEDNLIELAKLDWCNAMKDMWKELQLRFQLIKKALNNWQKEIAKAKKVAECKAKKAAECKAKKVAKCKAKKVAECKAKKVAKCKAKKVAMVALQAE